MTYIYIIKTEKKIHSIGARGARENDFYGEEMVSTKQLVANRGNAAKSLGPKTEAGLRVSSMNALRHGLLSKASIIDSEDEAELEDFVWDMKNSFQPQDELENLLVDRVISCAWRLKRVLKIEAHIFSGKEVWAAYLNDSDGVSFEAGKGEKVLLLSRYEVALERSLYRALSELRQIQSMRSTINANGFVS